MMNYSSLNVRKMTDFRTLFFSSLFPLTSQSKNRLPNYIICVYGESQYFKYFLTDFVMISFKDTVNFTRYYILEK